MSGGLNRGLEAILWGLGVRGISPTASRVLLRLCARVSGEDHRTDYDVWPSHKKIAEESEISASGVKRHLKELEDAGLIRLSPVERTDGSRSVNRYTLMVHGEKTRSQTPDEFRKNTMGQVELASVQSERVPSPRVTRAQFTAEPCNEPSNGTIEESPSNFVTVAPGGESEEADTDLFGGKELGPVVIPDLTDQEIGDAYVERWNRLCDEEEKLDRVDRFSAERQKELILRLGTRSPAEVGILLDELFRRIAGSRWLRGRGRNSTWKASWSWVLKKMNFNKIMEGQYVQDFDSENPDGRGNSGDRSHGQAGRDAARIIDAMRGRA